MPLFSIITINYNDAVGLQSTMDSVFDQTLTDYEYIVIDGGSTDGSLEIIKSNCGNIHFWVSENDDGIYDAMNKGIAVAKGGYCMFLNSGDKFYDKAVLQKVSDSGMKEQIIYGDLIYSKSNMTIGVKKNPKKITIPFLLVSGIGHQAQFIQKALFEQHGSYSTTFQISSDYEFFVKLYFKFGLITKHLPFPIAVYDISGISGNPNFEDQLYLERKRIQREHFPVLINFIYSNFNLIWRSKLLKSPQLATPIKHVRNIILRVFNVR